MIPRIVVRSIDEGVNVGFIRRFVDPEFNARNRSRPFAEGVYRLFPKMQELIYEGIPGSEIDRLVDSMVREALRGAKGGIQSKIKELQEKFDLFGEELIRKLLLMFEVEWPKDIPEIICYVGILPRFPRNVISKEFFVSYEADENLLMTASIHEINHFVMFEKWKAMHGYTREREPMHPEALWFLEELVVDPTLNEEVIQRVAAYPQRAYDQFYTQCINQVPVMDYIKEIYFSRVSMEDFLDRSYQFIERHLDEMKEKCG